MPSNYKINKDIDQMIQNSVLFDPILLIFILRKFKKIFILVPLIISFLIFIFSKSLPEVFQSNASIIVSDQNNIIDIQEVYDSQIIKNPNLIINTQVEILKSKELIERMISMPGFTEKYNPSIKNQKIGFFEKLAKIFFEKKNNNEIDWVKDIQKNLEIKAIYESNIIKLSFKSSQPDKAKFILESLLKVYLEYDIDQKIEITSYANIKINERLKLLKANLEDSEKKLHSFKEENKLIDLGDIKNLKSEEIKTISKKIVKTEQDLQTLQNNISQIKLAEGDLEDLLSINFVRDLKEVQNLKANLDANSATIDSLSLIYKDNHPKIIKAVKTKNNLISELKSIIDQNITVAVYEIANLENLISISNNELEKAREELQSLELKDLEMQKYIRDVNLNEKIYQIFLERLKETNEAKELQTPNSKILDSPNSPLLVIFPNPTKYSLISFFVTFLSLFILGSYYEIYRKSVNDIDILESNNIDSIGTIPMLDELEPVHPLLTFYNKSNTKFIESLKMANVIFRAKYNSAKTILITSPVAQEGKTTFAFNYAINLAENNKVIFLELDLRRPSLRKIFNLKSNNGIKDLFLSKIKFSEIVLKLPNSNLDIIPAGIPENNFIFPEESFENFLKILKINYDYIIIDSAPILPVVDTLLIAKKIDTTILVVRSDFTKLAGLSYAIQKVKNVSDCDITTVLNYHDYERSNYNSYSKYGSYYQNYYNYDSNTT